MMWQEPSGNPTPIVANTVSTWAVNDQLEVDSNSESWSAIYGPADISVINDHGFISVEGNVVTFAPTVAGTYIF